MEKFVGYDTNITGAVKHDKGKLRYDLIPPIPLEHLAQVYTFGADKYGDRNWEKGLSFDRLYAALQRHLMERRKGNMIDAETKLPHMASVMWCAMAIDHFDNQEPLPFIEQKVESLLKNHSYKENVDLYWLNCDNATPLKANTESDAPKPSLTPQHHSGGVGRVVSYLLLGVVIGISIGFGVGLLGLLRP